MAIDWLGLKRDYLSGLYGIPALADKYGCHPDTVRRKIKREGWLNAPASGPPEAAACCERRGCAPGDLKGEHRVLWSGVRKKLERGLGCSDLKTGLEELKVAKMAGEVISSLIRGERELWEMEDEVKTADDTEEIIREMASVTAPPGAGPALAGGAQVQGGRRGKKEREDGARQEEAGGGPAGEEGLG